MQEKPPAEYTTIPESPRSAVGVLYRAGRELPTSISNRVVTKMERRVAKLECKQGLYRASMNQSTLMVRCLLEVMNGVGVSPGPEGLSVRPTLINPNNDNFLRARSFMISERGAFAQDSRVHYVKCH